MATKRRWLTWTLIVLAAVILPATAWVLVLRQRGLEDIIPGPVATLTVSSPSIPESGMIPAQFTCKGAGMSPPLTISGLPAGTKSLAILADDADAPLGFVHWIAFNLPPDLLQIPEGAGSAPGQLRGGLGGANDFGTNTYAGPCPPTGTHRYRFHVYAVDMVLPLHEGATKQQLSAAATNHVLAEGTLTGKYSRRPEP
jgi:Raf kinase inhibitor-like YbhB/YbcL family protein